jgi:hypothetical protein
MRINDLRRRESIIRIMRMTEKEESLMGLSAHLLAIAENEKGLFLWT